MNTGEREGILLREQRRRSELNDGDGQGETTGKANSAHDWVWCGRGGSWEKTGSSVAYPFSHDLAMHTAR
jgi:hypothetical protein